MPARTRVVRRFAIRTVHRILVKRDEAGSWPARGRDGPSRPGPSGPGGFSRPISGRRRAPQISPESAAKRGPQSALNAGFEHRTQPELGRLGQPPVAMGDTPQLAGEPELAEARERLAVGAAERDALDGAGDRERPPQIG